MRYNKQPLDHDGLLQSLMDRGLEVEDKARALKYLKNVGYYRLTGYMYHLQSKDGNHTFLPNITINHIIQHYKFDTDLRILVTHYLERIEVALRARLTDYYSVNHGFYWYQDNNLYADQEAHRLINSEISTSFINAQERFLKYFKRKYTSEVNPPSNMALELLTFGRLTRMYKGLHNHTEKMEIAKDFNLPSTILASWLVYLNNVRNICAHHGRLWNRKITADKPKIPSREKYRFKNSLPGDFNSTMYGVVSLVDRLLIPINHPNSFTTQIEDLLESYSGYIKASHMGFPPNWRQDAPWK